MIKQGSRNYAKRQLTWFRKDSRVKYLDKDTMCHDDIGKAVMMKVLTFAEMWNDETFKYIRDIQNS